MENRIIIHVGMHKTATTFLQEELFPKIAEQNPQINFIDTFSIDMDIKDSSKLTIISDENLDGGSYRLFRNHEHRDRIARNIARMFPNAEIMICIRGKKSWLKSAYKQFVVGYGWTGSFGEYVSFMDPEVLKFEKYIMLLEELFKEVHVIHFDELVLNPERFVGNVCNILDVPIPHDINFSRKNVSITNGQVKLIQLISYFLPMKEMYFPVSVIIKLLRKDIKFGKWGRKI